MVKPIDLIDATWDAAPPNKQSAPVVSIVGDTDLSFTSHYCWHGEHPCLYKYIYIYIESKDTKKCICINIHIKLYASLCLVWKSSFPRSSVQQKVAPPNNEKILKRRICMMGPSSSKVVGTWGWCIYQCQF